MRFEAEAEAELSSDVKMTEQGRKKGVEVEIEEIVRRRRARYRSVSERNVVVSCSAVTIQHRSWG